MSFVSSRKLTIRKCARKVLDCGGVNVKEDSCNLLSEAVASTMPTIGDTAATSYRCTTTTTTTTDTTTTTRATQNCSSDGDGKFSLVFTYFVLSTKNLSLRQKQSFFLVYEPFVMNLVAIIYVFSQKVLDF